MKAIFVAFAVSICGMFFSYNVQASSNPDWLESVPYVFGGPQAEWSCRYSSWSATWYPDDPIAPRTSGWGCKEEIDDVEYWRGSFRTTANGVNDQDGVFAIKTGKTAGRMLPLYFGDTVRYFMAEGASVMAEQTAQIDGVQTTYIYKDINDSMYPSYSQNGNPIEMRFDRATNLKYVSQYPMSSVTSSSNKKYVVTKHYDVDTESGWIAKMDTSTANIDTIKIDGTYEEVLAVSNDGRYVVVGQEIYDTNSCWTVDGDEKCRHASLANNISRRASYAYVSQFKHVRFSESDQQIYMLAAAMKYGDDLNTIVPLTLSMHMQLDYLALGDSYTSGEGDIGRDPNYENFYTKSTKVGCHLSTRSYPYLLSEAWGFNGTYSKSVACSGALIKSDYSADINTYSGQRGELKSGARDEKIDSALLNYTPGVVPQLEFVKRYQPKVVTITGGGNDAGFAEVLNYCVGDWESFIYKDYSCEYIEGGVLHEMLNDSIDSQYKLIKQLITDIKEVSPMTKIYYIGYPSFIAGSDSLCSFNTGFLNGRERDMINDATSRLNNVIKTATQATGTKYVDIELSLNGGRLCEGSEYVTGLRDVGYANIGDLNIVNQAFHPNNKGHEKIAKSIEDKIVSPLGSSNIAPEHVEEIQPGVPTYHVKIIETTQIEEEETLTFSLDPGTTKGGSIIYSAGFSTPVNLGTYISNMDGSAHASVRVPKAMKPGTHLLVLDILTPNGEKNRLFQFFQITKPNIEAEKSKNVDTAAKKATVDKDLASSSSTQNLNIDNGPEEENYKTSVAINNTPVSCLAWLRDSKNVSVNGNKNGQLYLLAAILLVTIGGVWVYVKKSKR